MEAYEKKMERGELPLIAGHLPDEEDFLLRKNILELMCNNKTTLDRHQIDEQFYRSIVEEVRLMEEDGLVILTGETVTVTTKGSAFIRNICSALDARLWRKSNQNNILARQFELIMCDGDNGCIIG